MQQFDEKLVSGSIISSVWKLSWPFVGAQVVRGLNLLVAQSLVGHFVGHEGNAALGVGWQLFLVAFVMYLALLQGMAILIARYTGRQDSEALSILVFETFKASLLFLGCFLLPMGYFAAPWALNLMNTAPGVQEHALPFLRIVLLGGAPLLLVFLLNRAFQASGDVKVPLVLGIVSTLCNICLNVVFIVIFDMGVEGAAWGFVFGPVPSLCIALFLIYRGKMVIRPPKRHTLKLDFSVLKTIIRIGFPTGVTALIGTSVGAIMLAMLGSLEESAAAQAAFSVGFSQLFSFFTWVGLSLSAASNTLIGQNIGAGKPARGKKCVYMAVRLGGLWALVLGAVFWFFPANLLAVFAMTEGPVLEIGVELLRFLAFTGILTLTSQTFFGGLMGAGDTKSPMFITMISQGGVQLGYCFMVSRFSSLTATTIWTAILVAGVVRFILVIAVFVRGRWTHIKVELEDPIAVEPAEGGTLGG